MTTVELWWAALDDLGSRQLGWLDEAEIARRAQYRNRADADRFALGAALVRSLAADELGCTPSDAIVLRRCARCGGAHGPPTIVGSDLRLSISHSGGVVGLAAARVPVGLDVEHAVPIDLATLLPVVLSGAESAPEDLPGFYRYWTRKESFLKALGVGLPGVLTDVTVSRPGDPAALLSYGGRRPPCAMLDLMPGAGYVGCLAVLARGPLDVRVREARELLEPGIDRSRSM